MAFDPSSALATINGSITLAKAIAQASSAMDKAELKLKIAELVDQLLDSKEALVDARTLIQEYQTEIAQLKDVSFKINNLIEWQGFLYQPNEQGNAKGDPYCPRCIEAEKKLIKLRYKSDLADWNRVCPECKNQFLVDKAAKDQATARTMAMLNSSHTGEY
ncbi:MULTISPECIES: hypothetical protein [unclassified Thalassospira]|uniref:hypothetical protein n=1 Tax=unclassified Thalassospira TaxID=2648997 RepID=UPI0007A5FA91|nr:MULTISPECIES: hypothetical protein [unclassified Thalassospira]KZD02055.1 hypothetical protein AUQ41_00900 [Thalassospira sp. MCCC 1A02898]ONH86387.1 hypothetical protein TH47_16890 [Thalassospira sp. MCCC 1A02803]